MAGEVRDYGELDAGPTGVVDAGEISPEDMAAFQQRMGMQPPPAPVPVATEPSGGSAHPLATLGLDQPGNRRFVDASAMGQFGVLPIIANAGVQASPGGIRQPTSFAVDRAVSAPETELKPMSTGRTLADNAGSAYAKPLQLTVPRSGGGGGGGPGDFGVGAAQRQYRADQDKMLGNYDDQKQLAATRGVLEGDDYRAQAEIHQDTRVHLMELDQINQQRQQMEQQQLSQWHADTDQKNQAISAQKVDPTRIFHNQSDGDRFLFLLAAGIGGSLQGAGLTSSNAFLDNANKMIDRDVNAQKEAIDNQRAGLNQRNTMYGQFLQQYGRADLAAMETKNSMFESAKLQLSELASRTQEPMAQQRAKEQIAAIQSEQDKLRMSIDQGRLASAQQQAGAWAAQQAAASKAREAQRQQIILRAQHISDQGATNGKPLDPADAMRRATFEVTGQDIMGNDSRMPMADYSKPAEGDKEAGKLRVTLPDGTVKVAQSQEAKDKYVEFESTKQAYAAQNAALQNAWKSRDRAAYEAARGQLIEMMPTMYGFGRGPSKLQGMEQDEHGQKGTLTAAVPTWDELMKSQVVSSALPFVGDTNFVQNTLAGGDARNKFKPLDRLVDDLEKSREKAAFGEVTDRPKGVPIP